MNTKAIVALLLVVGAAYPVSAATNELTPDQIKTTFADGKPFTAVSTSGEVFVLTFKPDGSALEVAKGKKKGTTGKWRVSDKGYCTKWSASGEHCYTIIKIGSKYAVRGSAGQLISTWTR